MSVEEAEYGVALCECTECGEKFETSHTENGGHKFDGVREHGRKHHEDESWNYEVVEEGYERGD